MLASILLFKKNNKFFSYLDFDCLSVVEYFCIQICHYHFGTVLSLLSNSTNKTHINILKMLEKLRNRYQLLEIKNHKSFSFWCSTTWRDWIWILPNKKKSEYTEDFVRKCSIMQKLKMQYKLILADYSLCTRLYISTKNFFRLTKVTYKLTILPRTIYLTLRRYSLPVVGGIFKSKSVSSYSLTTRAGSSKLLSSSSRSDETLLACAFNILKTTYYQTRQNCTSLSFFQGYVNT